MRGLWKKGRKREQDLTDEEEHRQADREREREALLPHHGHKRLPHKIVVEEEREGIFGHFSSGERKE